ncbi:MAG: glutamyl-tRNA reductase [Bacteroidota bacterium]
MQPTFRAIGISYHNTPLEIRERVTFDESSCRDLLRKMNATFGIGEALILSTCNRTEVYYASEQPLTTEVVKLISVVRSMGGSEELQNLFVAFTEEQALRHLYEVSLGLDSKVLGDLQISNQVKRAYQWSADEGMAGPFLHRCLHSIFYANKRVIQETAFRDGSASTAYASVELLKQFAPNFHEPKVLLLGLGEIGGILADNLQDTGLDITIANRTIKRAQEIAQEYNYSWLPLDEALTRIGGYDVVISTVAGDRPLIANDMLDDGRLTQQLFIDLSLPRSIDPLIERRHNVILYNIDHIDQKTSAVLKKREKAIPQVRSIMEDSLAEFDNWAQEMEVSPTIQKLKNALEEIRKRELAKYVKKASDDEIKLLDSATKGIIQKVIRLPVLQLKAACKRGDAESLVETLHDLFDLEGEAAKK